MKYKRQRILTNREYPNKSFEAIEKDDKGQFYWYAEEVNHTLDEKQTACFPVDLDFVKDKFKECGREFSE